MLRGDVGGLARPFQLAQEGARRLGPARQDRQCEQGLVHDDLSFAVLGRILAAQRGRSRTARWPPRPRPMRQPSCPACSLPGGSLTSAARLARRPGDGVRLPDRAEPEQPLDHPRLVRWPQVWVSASCPRNQPLVRPVNCRSSHAALSPAAPSSKTTRRACSAELTASSSSGPHALHHRERPLPNGGPVAAQRSQVDRRAERVHLGVIHLRADVAGGRRRGAGANPRRRAPAAGRRRTD